MLKIRLARTGKRNQPAFRVVVQEHTRPPQGKFVEKVGFYNPRLKEKSFNKQRIKYWLSQGAQPTPTVHNLLVDEGIIKGSKVKATVGHKEKDKEEEKKEEEEEKEEDNNDDDDDRDNDHDTKDEKAKGKEEE